MSLRGTLASFTVAWLVVGAACLAHAGLIAYDGFADGGATPGPGQYQTTPASTNGKDNDSLYGQGPALTGFDGGVNWTGPASSFAAHVYFRAEGGGLSYTDGSARALDTTAGQVNLFRSTPGVYDKNIGRDSNDSAAPPTVMYFSALIQPQAGLVSRVGTQWGTKDSIGIGFDAGGHAQIGTTTTGNAKGTSAAAFADGVPHLLVGKIVEGGRTNDYVTLYVDPADLSDEAANTPTLSSVSLEGSYYVSGNPSYSLDSVHLSGGVTGGSSILYDELRVGSTWQDVVPSGAPQASVLSFQEGVSPDASYVAGSTTVRSDRPTSAQDDDPDGENIVGRVDTDDFMRAFFEFDLSELETFGRPVTSAELRLTTRGTESGQGSDLTINLFDYGFDFDEATATWNNPAPGDTTPGGELGTFLAWTEVDPSQLDALVTFGSTSAFATAVQHALAADDNTLRLIVTRDDEVTSGANHFVRFWDEEVATPAFRPELVVTLAPIPEPATLALLALGLLGCARRRKRA